jgi:hypothetical protein
MVDTKTEAEVLRKANGGICYVKGCDKPGKSRVQITYAKDNRQVIVNAWACDNYEHRGGR